MPVDRRKTKWYGWGWNEKRYDLKGHEKEMFGYLGKTLEGDFSDPSNLPVDVNKIKLPSSRASKNLVDEFARIMGDKNLSTEHYERLVHSFGKSFHDLVRVRSGRVEAAPDVVLYPETIEEVVALVELAGKEGIALIPFGGGSSVVGGLDAADPKGRTVATVDLTHMERLLNLNRISQLATFEAGAYGPSLEEALERRGYSLGHFPQSFEFSTLGGWIAARSAGQQSNQYGKIEHMLASCRVVTPKGDLVTLNVPASAAGPDLDQLIAGSEGTLGLIVDATVKVHPVPEMDDIRTVLFKDFAEGCEAVREIVQSGLNLSYLRLSDSVETDMYQHLGTHNMLVEIGQRALATIGYGSEKAALIVGAEGRASKVRREIQAAIRICRRHKGMSLGNKPSANWKRDRFHHPYLRDTMLDHGIATDTLETSITWDKALDLYHEVKAAIEGALAEQGHRSIVMAHLSHSYTAGSCIYFIFIYPLAVGKEVEQWWPVKRAACDAIARLGGTISHHHGVGLDHRDWMAKEKGKLGIEAIRAVKERLDPQDLMNPGKLIAPIL